MPTFAEFLVMFCELPRRAKFHASLQQGGGFVFTPPIIPPPPTSVPTQQIVIESSSICSVSYGGSR